MTNLSDIISIIYDASITPRPDDTITIPTLKVLIGKVCLSPDRKVRFPSASDDDIAHAFLFLCRMVDMTPSLRGLHRIQVPLKILAGYFLDLANVDPAAKGEFLAICDKLSETLKPQGRGKSGDTAKSPDSDFAVFDSPPFMLESPLLYFHYYAHRFSILNNDAYNCPLYRKYGPLFHLAIRIYEKQEPNDNTHLGRLLAARHFFHYLPQKYKDKPVDDHPNIYDDTERISNAFNNYIEEAMSNYNALEHGVNNAEENSCGTQGNSESIRN